MQEDQPGGSGTQQFAVERKSPEGMSLLRQFFETAFSTIIVDGRRVAAIEPKPEYAGLFVLGLAPQIVRTGALDWTPARNSVAFAVVTRAGAISIAGIDSIAEILWAA